MMNQPIYNPYQCNRCLELDFAYFDNEVHRWCRAWQKPLKTTGSLTGNAFCDKLNRAKKGKVSKARYLDKEDYLRRHPE